LDLKATIAENTKDAMRAKDKARLGVLRLVGAAIKQVEVDERRELGDDDVLGVLEKMLKQRRESKEQFESAGRDELAAQESFEIDIIESYMPEALSDGEVESLITSAIESTGASSMKDMGKVMGVLRPELKGRADMKAVSAMIKSRLGG
jgi:uncharacterized protein YqeY